jgi:hypothetical protein
VPSGHFLLASPQEGSPKPVNFANCPWRQAAANRNVHRDGGQCGLHQSHPSSAIDQAALPGRNPRRDRVYQPLLYTARNPRHRQRRSQIFEWERLVAAWKRLKYKAIVTLKYLIAVEENCAWVW